MMKSELWLMSLASLKDHLFNRELESRKSKIGELWLRSCRLARKESLLQVAFGSLMSAEKFNLPQYAIEHSKYLYKKVNIPPLNQLLLLPIFLRI